MKKVKSPLADRGERLGAAGFLVLPVIIYCIFCFLPTVLTMGYSLFRWDGLSDEVTFVGLKNFISLFKTNASFKIAVTNTIIYTLFVVIVQNTLGLLIAVQIYRESRINNMYRTLFYLPVILSAVTIGFTWSFIYDPNIGVLNTLLRKLGLNDWTHIWLAEKYVAVIAIAFVHVWSGLGNVVVLYIAGLQGVSNDLLEAASIDGCNSWQRFWRVTFPTLLPTVVLVVVMSMIGSFKAFELVWTMTQGGSDKSSMLLALQAYKEAFVFSDVGSGSAVAVVLLIIVSAFSVIQIKLTDRK